MSEWKEVRLGDVCSIFGRIGFRGYTTEDLVETPQEGAISLSPSNIVQGDLNLDKLTYIKWIKYEESPEIKIKRNDILLVKTGSSIGRTTIVKEVVHPMTLNPQLVVLKDITINPLYLSYLIKGYYFQGLIHNIAGGSAIPTLSQKHLSDLKITICDNDTQNKIAQTISPIDDKIAVNKKICENLEAQAQALFKHWFVDFAPFKDGKFVESELGLIPEGWRVGNLGEICTYSSRKIAIKKLTKNTYYSTENMLPNKSGAVEASSLPQVEMTTECLPYDVLVSNIRPYFKKIIRVGTTCGCSTDVLCFHPIDSKYMSYMYRVLYDDSFFAYVMAGSKGTKMPRGDKQQIMKYPIAIPTNFVLKEFSNLVEPMFELISLSNNEIQTLSSLRDTLLPKLMSGQIKVNEIERAYE